MFEDMPRRAPLRRLLDTVSLTGAIAVAAWLGACTVDEAALLGGKPCAEDGSCAPGYACVREPCGQGYLCPVCRPQAGPPDAGPDGEDGGGDGGGDDGGEDGDGALRCDQAPPACKSLPDCLDQSPSCLDGYWRCETGYQPLETLCDGLDNDCDGRTDSGLVCLLAGHGQAGLEDGLGPTARFSDPRGLALEPSGLAVLVADRGNHAIRRVDLDGLVTTLAGDGRAGDANGPAAEARFREPAALTFGPDGALLVADSLNHRIRRIASDGTVTTLAGSGFADHLDGPAAEARFALPGGLAVAQDGSVLVADTGNHCLRRVREALVTTLAGRCESPGFQDGLAEARFNRPTDLLLLPDGRLVVSEESSHALRLVDPDGRVTTLAGDGQAGFLDGPLGQARFWKPAGLAREASTGDLLLADYGNHRVRKLGPAEVSTALGRGAPGFDDGPAAEASLRYPSGLVSLPDGRLVIADTKNHALRILRP
jgi:sugar lactone lactonase YvrE